jgi:hypothetical protein
VRAGKDPGSEVPGEKLGRKTSNFKPQKGWSAGFGIGSLRFEAFLEFEV